MKKLLVAITALVVLGIAGTTQQAFAHGGNHAADSVLIEITLTNLTNDSGLINEAPTAVGGFPNVGIVPVPMSTNPTQPGGRTMQHGRFFMTDNSGSHLNARPLHDGGSGASRFYLETNRNSSNRFQAGICEAHVYPFTVDGDGNVSPADGIFVDDNSGCGENSGVFHIELRSVGAPYSQVENEEPTGGSQVPGVAGADGADGSDGADGAPGAAGAQGPQGKAGADGAAGAAAACTPCADVTDAAAELSCKLLGTTPPTSVQELQEFAQTIVNTLLISANICEPSCDVGAGIAAAIDAKLNP